MPKETGAVIFGGHGKVGADTNITYLPQRSVIDRDFPVTVHGMVEMGRYMRLGIWRRLGKADAQAVDEALRTIGLVDLAERQISALFSSSRRFAGSMERTDGDQQTCPEPIGRGTVAPVIKCDDQTARCAERVTVPACSVPAWAMRP